MLVLLASLIVAYRISRRDRPERPSALERWAVRAPLGLYLGWVSVATIANISAALYAAGWSGWGIRPAWWSVIVLLVGAILAFLGLVLEGDGVFAGVFVWAFAGIAVATPSSLVRMVAGVLAAAIAVGIVVSAVREATQGVASPTPHDCYALQARDRIAALQKELLMPRVALNVTAPDFTLPDLNGDPVSLSDFLGRKNVLLVFNRTFA